MAECDAPSFSLGLDFSFDLDTPPHSPLRADPPPSASPGDDPGPQVPDSDPETRPDPPCRILKRLRRGPPPSSVSQQVEPPPFVDPDDDIEEFSSQEDPVQVPAQSSAWNHSVCSSSKVSLNGCRVLTPHSSGSCREKKRKQASDVPASAKIETGQSGVVFPKFTASPLRRFQLIDSDSDFDSDDAVGEDVYGASKVDPSSMEAMRDQNKPFTSFEQSRKTSFNVNQDQDLWRDFSPVKSFSIPTPAFNEVFEEYFCSSKNKEVEKSGIDISENHNEPRVNFGCQKDQQLWESANPIPPAHRYFFHEDPRIQQLVRSRLCNFSPLGVKRVNQQPNVSHIDYMGQFNNGGASKTQGVQKGYANSSTSGRNKSKNLFVEETFNASEGWVDPKISQISSGKSSRKKATKRNSTKNSVSKSKNETNKLNSSDWVEPKSCASMPKDAGKRRVQASGQSAGHWYTGSDGRKVYVNKSGQELTGQSAYRQYRKESGAGFKRSKKKTSAKKTNAKKRN